MALTHWSCCGSGLLNKNNLRLVLLTLFIIIYLMCGAVIFSALEQPTEQEAKLQWEQRLELFRLRSNLNRTEIDSFLQSYEEAMAVGIRVDALRPRWDFTGAFFFVVVMLSSIGFGMTTPATVSGKVFLMFYGLLGCSATILFFNLFLERVITVIAIVLKSCHERRQNKAVFPQSGGKFIEERGDVEGREESHPGWKPSVYCVMLILGAAAVLVSCCASLMYSAAEGWGYLDSLYFCFVAFSTIGFGDMVSSQRLVYEGQATTAYQLGNFLFILTGVCCIYSLFNVISIVIKQVLNWLLRRLEAPCRCCLSRKGPLSHRHPRRNVVAPGQMRSRRDPSIETDGINESETDTGRRMSGEMISIRDFLAANKHWIED
ncbi:potassium channel subfamily K member 13-like isoform 3-T3 [Synchiropus picturatus]